eukprot:3283388-Rhodomonas_salina.1
MAEWRSGQGMVQCILTGNLPSIQAWTTLARVFTLKGSRLLQLSPSKAGVSLVHVGPGTQLERGVPRGLLLL